MLLRTISQLIGFSSLKLDTKEEVMKYTDRMPEEIPGTKWDTTGGVMRARSADVPELDTISSTGGALVESAEESGDHAITESEEAVARARLVGERLIARACAELPPGATLTQRHDAIQQYLRNLDKHLDEFLAPVE